MWYIIESKKVCRIKKLMKQHQQGNYLAETKQTSKQARKEASEEEARKEARNEGSAKKKEKEGKEEKGKERKGRQMNQEGKGRNEKPQGMKEGECTGIAVPISGVQLCNVDGKASCDPDVFFWSPRLFGFWSLVWSLCIVFFIPFLYLTRTGCSSGFSACSMNCRNVSPRT